MCTGDVLSFRERIKIGMNNGDGKKMVKWRDAHDF